MDRVGDKHTYDKQTTTGIEIRRLWNVTIY